MSKADPKKEKLIVDNKTYTKGKKLGNGCNGWVYELTDDACPTTALAIKEFCTLVGAGKECKIIQRVYGNAVLSERIVIRHKIEGNTLESCLDSFSPQQFLEMIINLLNTYQWLHKFGVYHYDIKSPNILLDKNGYIYPIDFELSVYPVTLEKFFSQETRRLKELAYYSIRSYIGKKWVPSDNDLKILVIQTAKSTLIDNEEQIPTAANEVLDFKLVEFDKLCDITNKEQNLQNVIDSFKDLYIQTYHQPPQIHQPKFAYSNLSPCDDKKDEKSNVNPKDSNSVSIKVRALLEEILSGVEQKSKDPVKIYASKVLADRLKECSSYDQLKLILYQTERVFSHTRNIFRTRSTDPKNLPDVFIQSKPKFNEIRQLLKKQGAVLIDQEKIIRDQPNTKLPFSTYRLFKDSLSKKENSILLPNLDLKR